MSALREFVQQATVVYRHGDVVKFAGDVVSIDAFPESPRETVVDCHFIDVGFTDAVSTRTAREFYALVADAEIGEFGSISMERLAAGPSYIEIGGWVGDQTLAFQFMALCEYYHLSKVITPNSLGITGQPLADSLAGSGYVMLAGFKSSPMDAPL